MKYMPVLFIALLGCWEIFNLIKNWDKFPASDFVAAAFVFVFACFLFFFKKKKK